MHTHEPDSSQLVGLADRIEAALPQTQCTRCGYPDCRGYAEAIASTEADINRCPPGGAEGILRLAAISARRPKPLDPACGTEGPLRLAVIDEAWCIGCTLCTKACPVDCIVGASKLMHTVVDEQCTGCELCLPACPVDCISMVDVSGPLTGWQAWPAQRALSSRGRYAFHQFRLERERRDQDLQLAAKAQAKLADLDRHSKPSDPQALARKAAVIEAALARARVPK